MKDRIEMHSVTSKVRMMIGTSKMASSMTTSENILDTHSCYTSSRPHSSSLVIQDNMRCVNCNEVAFFKGHQRHGS